MNALETVSGNTQIIDVNALLTHPTALARLQEFSVMMSRTGLMIPEHFRNKPDACAAVTLQALRWGMDPIAVAGKTNVINQNMSYQAQLVMAVINTRAPIKGRLNFRWDGDWSKIVGKVRNEKNKRGDGYHAIRGWDYRDEKGLSVTVWATFKDENEPRELQVQLDQVIIRNSTLWVTDPRQQLAYLAAKKWASLHCSEVVLGVSVAGIDDEEATQPTEERVINPRATVGDIIDGDKPTSADEDEKEVEDSQETAQDEPEEADVVEEDKSQDEEEESASEPETLQNTHTNKQDLAGVLEKGLKDAENVEAVAAAGEAIKTAQRDLVLSDYLRLHAAATSKFKRLKAIAALEQAVDSVGEPGTDEGRESFELLEATLRAGRRLINEADYSRFYTVIEQLRPRYQA